MQERPELNINADIEISSENDKELEAIRDSLYPDNINFPENIKLDMKTSNSSLLLNFRFITDSKKENSIDTLLNTIDEILEHIGIIKNVIKND